jgi:hypothetical protein
METLYIDCEVVHHACTCPIPPCLCIPAEPGCPKACPQYRIAAVTARHVLHVYCLCGEFFETLHLADTGCAGCW